MRMTSLTRCAAVAAAAVGLSTALVAAPALAAPASVARPLLVEKYAYGCRFATATPQISYGSSGAAVKQAQCLLNYWLSAGLAVDGQFGTKTRAAVEYFQSEYCNLAVDGIVGPKTWYALENPGCP